MKPLLAIAVLAFVLCVSCASPEQSAYKVVGSTAVTVDAAMQGWGDYVRSGNATLQEQQKVRDAYSQYQKSMQVLHRAVLAYRSSADKPLLDQSLNVLEASKTELIAAIVKAEKE